ncbi:MAG: glycosyltransferase family 1 protein [Propionibacteriaceae bacterium]|nr:glycosyltransferase family 1 protein [Propionibacteriaceae bacterium]
MRLLLVAWGSRGDVQPYLALGRGLAASGYDVAVAATRDAGPLVVGAGLEHRPFDLDMGEAVQEPLLRQWLAGAPTPRAEVAALRRVMSRFAPVVAAGLPGMASDADGFVTGVLTLPALATVGAATRRPVVGALTFPQLPTRSAAATLQPQTPGRDSWRNRVGGLVGLAAVQAADHEVSAAIRRAFGLPGGTWLDDVRAVRATPTAFGVSRHVLPRPADWPGHATVSGYWFTDVDGAVPDELEAFLAAGPAPAFVSFGSMPVDDDIRKLVLAAVASAGCRAVLSGGLHHGPRNVEQLGDRIISVGSVSHARLFPRVAGVVTHGGAGTVGAALRAGAPVGVVWHMGDQPYWGWRVAELGAGPAPLPRRTLTTAALAAMLRSLVGNPALVSRAAALAEAIRGEDGVAAGVAAITRALS